MTEGQTLNVLYSFTNTPDGFGPQGGLLVSGNKFYGVTGSGGSYGYGTVFSMNNDGSGEMILHSFSKPAVNANGLSTNWDGFAPSTGLVLDGNTLFGAVHYGGLQSFGTLFSLQTDGSQFRVLHTFTSNPDGSYPSYYQNLVLSGDTLYGSTANGGNRGNGTVFSILTNGMSYTILMNFTNVGGANPYMGVVSSGKIFGTCNSGGPLPNGGGVVFSMNTDGSGFYILHAFATIGYTGSAFTNADGGWPSGLVLSGNTLYGNCGVGNTNGNGILFSVNTDDSDFTRIHTFDTGIGYTNADGEALYDKLTLSGDTLYGVAQMGGTNSRGTLFALKTNGTAFTVLHTFDANSPNVSYARGSLALGQGILYGTGGGGNANSGAVFGLNIAPQIQTSASNFGVQTNQFSFNLTGYSNQVIIVEASSNLTGSNWVPVQTNTIGSGATFFSDSNWTNYPGRFYRLRSP